MSKVSKLDIENAIISITKFEQESIAVCILWLLPILDINY